jgi:hypothetical protein
MYEIHCQEGVAETWYRRSSLTAFVILDGPPVCITVGKARCRGLGYDRPLENQRWVNDHED